MTSKRITQKDVESILQDFNRETLEVFDQILAPLTHEALAHADQFSPAQNCAYETWLDVIRRYALDFLAKAEFNDEKLSQHAWDLVKTSSSTRQYIAVIVATTIVEECDCARVELIAERIPDHEREATTKAFHDYAKIITAYFDRFTETFGKGYPLAIAIRDATKSTPGLGMAEVVTLPQRPQHKTSHQTFAQADVIPLRPRG